MSLYTTPLQFGYFLARLFGLLFVVRGKKEERLSDILMGVLLFILALDIQDYTFGFAGINVLWNELNGFPRGVALLVGPVLYFYLKAQLNSKFTLHWKDAIHLVPWLLQFVILLVVFLQGKYAVQQFQMSKTSELLGQLQNAVRIGSYIFYFYLSLKLYKAYRVWSLNHVSNADVLSFKWYRNVIYGLILGYFFKEGMNVVDGYLDLDFYQDWWWNLGLVAIIIYLSIYGYSQTQPKYIDFGEDETDENDMNVDGGFGEKLNTLMQMQKPFLIPDLTINQLSKQFNVPINELSSYLNTVEKRNFNDYVNAYRIAEFKQEVNKPENAHYTLLSIGLDCGFNSKSTFNRAFKKVEGKSPSQWKSETIEL